jgi:cation:H+ antiporter
MKADKVEEIPFTQKSNLKIWSLIILGFSGLIIGGKLVVDNSIGIATDLGISQKIIGLTIIAAGTSLPDPGISLYNASCNVPAFLN